MYLEQGIGGYDAQTITVIALGIAAAIAASVPSDTSLAADDAIPTVYDVVSVTDYFRSRPVLVARRTAAVLAAAARFGLALALDRITGSLGRNTPRRARQLREAIERLGPAYVKVARPANSLHVFHVPLIAPSWQLVYKSMPESYTSNIVS